MTTPKVTKIGLIAHYSPQGDWAFEAALRIAREHGATLNVFCFLESPYEAPAGVSPSQAPIQAYDEQIQIDADRQLRDYYEDRLGDFVEVGFRVCDSGRHNLELRMCLKRKEYQLLVIPHLEPGATFGSVPIEEFAYRFHAPVLLVGPETPDQYLVNPPAEVIEGSTGLLRHVWSLIEEPAVFQETSVI